MTRLCDISEIRPHLYLSGFGCINEKKLRQLGITHAVDATNIPRNPQYDGIQYLFIALDDNLIANILRYVETVINFIEEARKKGGKTLVYCAAGVSRSASLCIMYLMRSEKMSLREAYFDVQEKRPLISPNIGFWRQMIDFESNEYGQKSVELLKGMRQPVPDVYLGKAKEKGSTWLRESSKPN